jgi:hypothetical protein
MECDEEKETQEAVVSAPFYLEFMGTILLGVCSKLLEKMICYLA